MHLMSRSLTITLVVVVVWLTLTGSVASTEAKTKLATFTHDRVQVNIVEAVANDTLTLGSSGTETCDYQAAIYCLNDTRDCGIVNTGKNPTREAVCACDEALLLCIDATGCWDEFSLEQICSPIKHSCPDKDIPCRSPRNPCMFWSSLIICPHPHHFGYHPPPRFSPSSSTPTRLASASTPDFSKCDPQVLRNDTETYFSCLGVAGNLTSQQCRCIAEMLTRSDAHGCSAALAGSGMGYACAVNKALQCPTLDCTTVQGGGSGAQPPQSPSPSVIAAIVSGVVACTVAGAVVAVLVWRARRRSADAPGTEAVEANTYFEISHQ
eukprot:TRINITY_DN537_c0_g1_i2.p1 TRINITY_DN537_c0_g1~~TRINITY_DN537_c0_g1_i2.p1  ORF type:complete len:323 (-),score=2.36 TRINITY_DN537_c0_g1_i2:277-1245(-)